MQQAWTGLLCEGALHRCEPNLLDQRSVGPREEPVFRHGVIPDEFSKVIERGQLGQVNVLHHRQDIQQARDAAGLLFHLLFVPVLGFCLARSALHEQLCKSTVRISEYVPLSLCEIEA